MMGQPFSQWIVQSVIDPRSVAEALFALAFEREHLWMALVAFSALNAVFFGLPFLIDPVAAQGLPPFMQQPVIFAFISFASTTITVFGLHWTGQALGGDGRLDHMLAVMVWLQLLQVVLQAVVFAFAFIMPTIAGLVGLIAMPLGLWICVNFVDCVHGFESLIKAFAVMVLWVVGLILGLSMILALLGVTAGGLAGNV